MSRQGRRARACGAALRPGRGPGIRPTAPVPLCRMLGHLTCPRHAASRPGTGRGLDDLVQPWLFLLF